MRPQDFRRFHRDGVLVSCARLGTASFRKTGCRSRSVADAAPK